MPRTQRATAKPKKSELDSLRTKLAEQREEILALYQRDLKVGQSASDDGSDDIVDRANNAYNREFMFSLSGTERKLLLEIEEAIERLDGNGFGECGHCGERIPMRRLKAVPWTKFCVDCQERAEEGLLPDA